MPHVLRDGCRLSYSLDGNPQAPALMFSNSLGTTRELWAPQVARLSSAFRVIRYDTRGQGGSDAPKGTYTMRLRFSTLQERRVRTCAASHLVV
jgi:3-oxoadipate enol-lactonase